MENNALMIFLKVILAICLIIAFGFKTVNSIAFKRIIWTINNLVGLVFMIFWIILLKKNYNYLPQKKEKKLINLFKISHTFVTILTILALILQFFNIDLYSWIWSNIIYGLLWILKIIGWIVLGYLGLIVAALILFGLFLLISEILSKIKRVKVKQTKETKIKYLDDKIIEGDTCPNCHLGKVVMRINKKDGKRFLGCTKYHPVFGCKFYKSIEKNG